MRTSTLGASPNIPTLEPLLDVRQAAALLNQSVPSIWRAVATGRLPLPVYPTARSPRWVPAELRAALEATRALPAEAKEARRQRRLNTAA